MVISTSACTAVDIDFGKVRLGAFARHWRPPPMPARSASAPSPRHWRTFADTHRDQHGRSLNGKTRDRTAMSSPPRFHCRNQDDESVN